MAQEKKLTHITVSELRGKLPEIQGRASLVRESFVVTFQKRPQFYIVPIPEDEAASLIKELFGNKKSRS